MADKYYRLVSFLVNICPQPLRELFLKYMNADPTRAPTCTTLSAYIASKKPQLKVLQNRKLIRQDQWQLLFPRTGLVDESSWDTTLVILLLEEFFKTQLQAIEEGAIKEIRKIRNRLQHIAETFIADADFDGMWNILENATMDLAKQIQPSPAYEDTIKEYIYDTKINNMPKLGDSLRYWYEHIIMQLKSDFEDMKNIIMGVSEQTADNVKYTKECRTILHESSVKRDRPSGHKVKRMKTVDQILEKLNKYFITTFNEYLPGDFDSPPEVADIKKKLHDAHYVVVTGFRGTRYLETALAAIHDIHYNQNRCVEIRDSLDWRHVDPEEVDLVLCREPFGDSTFEKARTKSMADIFSNMLRTAQTSDESKHLDIVIVCDIKVLQQVLDVHEHNILKEVVKVSQPTSETAPADLTGTTNAFEVGINPQTQNLLDFSAIFMDQNRDDNLHSKEVCEKAKSMLKRNKVVLITGPRKCGKTVLALYLASFYQAHQFLILNKPEDIKLVSLDSICLVLVEDFAGKYRFEESRACAWLEAFDMYYSVVKAGKLNMIITCEENMIKKCREKFCQHRILGNIIPLQYTGIVVKSEPIIAGTSEVLKEKKKIHRDSIELLHDEISGMHDRNRLPGNEVPRINESLTRNVSDEIAEQLYAIDASVKSCCYRFETLQVLVDDPCNNEIKNKVLDVLKRNNVKNYDIVSSIGSFKQLHNVGEKVHPNSDRDQYGSLGGFAKKKKKDLVTLMSRHVGIRSNSRRALLRDGHKQIRAKIIPETLPRQEPQYKILDISAAEIHPTDKEKCDTMFRSEAGELTREKQSSNETRQLRSRQVHLWGCTTSPGFGIITIPRIRDRDRDNTFIIVENIKNTNEVFCKRGDSGSMVCADDIDGGGVEVVSMLIGEDYDNPCKYATFRIDKG